MKNLFAAALFAASCVPAFAADHSISQQGRRFHPGEITIAKGDTLTIANNDEFIHQIFLQSPGFSFDTAEKSPGQNIVEAFTASGTFEVQCHIHPKMKLLVHVN
jgi:plastocyanin